MQGRCAGDGCGFEGSYKQSLSHVQRCSAFAELYVNAPDRALDPAEEYRRVHDRPVAAVERAVRPKRTEAPPAPARVAAPSRPRAHPAPAPAGDAVPERVRGAVNVEYWGVSGKLI